MNELSQMGCRVNEKEREGGALVILLPPRPGEPARAPVEHSHPQSIRPGSTTQAQRSTCDTKLRVTPSTKQKKKIWGICGPKHGIPQTSAPKLPTAVNSMIRPTGETYSRRDNYIDLTTDMSCVVILSLLHATPNRRHVIPPFRNPRISCLATRHR